MLIDEQIIERIKNHYSNEYADVYPKHVAENNFNKDILSDWRINNQINQITQFPFSQRIRKSLISDVVLVWRL